MGALIEVVGSSFSGKTYLISKLIEELQDCKVILFEKHFVRESVAKGYSNFYKDILASLKEGNVISESVYAHQNNPWIDIKFNNCTTILCEPSYLDHSKRCKAYAEKYGISAYIDRAGEIQLNHQRNWAKKGLKSYLLYDGNNFDSIIEQLRSNHVD